MTDVICGLLLLAIGYFAGSRRVAKPQITLTDEELAREKKRREEWEKMLEYRGRKTNADE